MMIRHFPVFVGLLAVLSGLATPARAQVDFATQIQPIFAEHCAQCHGETRGLGRVRLHSPEAIRAIPKENVLVAGNPDQSILFERISLPADDPKRMPKEGDPLPEETIALIGRWIEGGATLPGAEGVTDEVPARVPQATPVPAVADADEAGGTPAASVAAAVQESGASVAAAPATLPPVELEPLDLATNEAVQQLREHEVRITPLSQDAWQLYVTYDYVHEPVHAPQLAALGAIADYVVVLDLGRKEVTDEDLAALAALKNLTHLHLELTDVTDAGLEHLAGLTRLEYLNIYGTKVTDAGFAHLRNLSQLRELYLWQTAVSYDAAMAFQGALAGRQVNLGWDHPMVAQKRLEKEVAEYTARKEEAEARKAVIDEQLAQAVAEVDNLSKILTDAQVKLSELTGETIPVEEPARGGRRGRRGRGNANADDNAAPQDNADANDADADADDDDANADDDN